MTRSRLICALSIVLSTIGCGAAEYQSSAQVSDSTYFPSRDNWERRRPADVGMDPARLNDAIEFMKTHETTAPARDFSDQETIFGKLLGSMSTERGSTNGRIVNAITS